MYDIIYIGGGLNYAGAIVASRAGKKVALIQEDLKHLGGSCLHQGCIPSKMFLHYSHLVYESKDPILKGQTTLDMALLVQKKNKLLQSAAKAVTKQCSDFELIEGKAELTAPYEVTVNGTTLKASAIVIGTGSRPFIPEGIHYDGKNIITSNEVLMLNYLPKEIAIYGDGAIGLEMASFFATAGSQVTLIYRHQTIQPHAHETIQEGLINQLDALGIKRLPQKDIQTAKHEDNGVKITYSDGETQSVPLLLIAVGRLPNKEVVACKGIEVQRGIVTNERYETTLKNHYAIGDCNGKVQLAHAARAQALNVTQTILDKQPDIINLDHIVKFIHTLPMSYALVGKTASQLQKEGIEFKQSLVTLNQFTYSAYNHARKGVMITYADTKGKILGAEILAPNAEELIASVAISLAGELHVKQAASTILAHPTFSEALERTFYKMH